LREPQQPKEEAIKKRKKDNSSSFLVFERQQHQIQQAIHQQMLELEYRKRGDISKNMGSILSIQAA